MAKLSLPTMTRLKRERKKARLSQTELALLSGVSQSFISRLETNSVNDAAFSILEDLATVLKRRGAHIEAKHLQPRRQPLLVKGIFAEPKTRKRIA